MPPVLTRRCRCLAEVALAAPGEASGEAVRGRGSRGAAGNRAPRAPGGRARAPSSPGRTGRRGGRAALTRCCCCRLLTATAAADAALCRSSAACPGRSRLRVNLRVRSLAIARRGPGARVPPPSPAPTSSTHRRSGSGTRSLPRPPPPPRLPRSTRKRRVFLSDTPHPLRSAEASRRLSKLCAPAGARGQLGRRPRPGCCASGVGTAGRAWGGSGPRQPPASAGHPRLCPQPPGPACGGGGARGGGGRGAPGGACPPPSCPFGGSLRRWSSGRVGFAPTFRGWREGAGRAQFALPALESDQRLINGLVAGISAASPEPGFQSLLFPKSSLRALE